MTPVDLYTRVAVVRRSVVVLLGLLALTAFSQSTAEGHALLLRSDPAAGVAVATAPQRVSLWFSEPVQVESSGVAVLNTSERRVDKLDAQVMAGEPGRVDISLGDITEGSYVVRWQVTSADNHVVSGSTWFAVGFAATPPPVATLVGSAPPRVSVMETVARWLVYLSVLSLAGAPAFRLLVLRGISPPNTYVRATQRTALAGGAIGIAGMLLWNSSQAQAVAGTAFPQALTWSVMQTVLFGSRFAILWWLRLVTAIGLLVVFTRGVRAGLDRIALGLGILLVASISIGSHGSGVPGIAAVAVLADFVHLAAAAIWLGGLIQLLLLIRTAREPGLLRTVTPRVSRIGLTCVALLVVTGMFSGWLEVQRPSGLFSTSYGQTLLVKIGIVALLVAVAAMNLLVIRPRITWGTQAAGALAGLVLAEVALAAGVLVAAALLTSLAPPGQQPPPTRVEATRQADDLRVTLTADPDWVGISHFSVGLRDASGQTPSDVESVTLTFAMQGMNMGRTNVLATRGPTGAYEAEGYFVGMPGIAEVGVAVQRSSGVGQSATFQLDVPDVSQSQFEGARANIGIGISGLLGAALAIAGLVALAGWRMLAGHARVGVFSAGLSVVICGGGLILADGALALGARATATNNPVARDANSLSRGKATYAARCQVCHGETGVGNGPAAAALAPPPADLTLHARWHGDPQLFWFVSNGVAGTAMPAFNELLSERDRWDVINYLHLLAEAPTATVQVASVAPTPQPQPSPSATPTSLTGRIVYGPDTDHDFWVVQVPATVPPRKITTFGALDFASMPAWSPDGRQIAYSYYQLPRGGGIPLPPGTDLYVMNADGTSQRPVAPHDVPGAVLQTPAWSSDGASLFASYQAQRANGSLDIGIDRIDLAGGAWTRIVSNASAPALSRDGQYLAYAQVPSGSVRSFTLWRSAVDGGNMKQLIGPNVFVKYQGLRFSPDGARVLFAAVGNGQGFSAPAGGLLPGSPLEVLARAFDAPPVYADGDLWDLWTIDADGRNLRRVTAINEDLPVSAWSPDSRAIAFLGGGSTITAQGGVSIVDANAITTGANILRLTVQPGHRGLDWTSAP